MRSPHPQSVQQALNACDLAHTGTHRAIAALKAGAHLAFNGEKPHAITKFGAGMNLRQDF